MFNKSSLAKSIGAKRVREPKPHFSCSIRIKSGQGRVEQLPGDDDEEVDILYI